MGFKAVADRLRLLLEEQSRVVGLLVSQRMLNLPPQLLPHLYAALFDEVSWATEDEPTEELRNSFKFKHYIILSKIYVQKSAQQKRKPSNDNDEAIIYVKAEDEIFHKLRKYRPTGLVMAVEVDKIATFRQELASLLSET
ncbi:hypothetical protein Fmac_004655 [Flemingia macrophylla]|uniref:BCCIP-like protein n=1 Tax=Flemingia macrophylla TaxID=520843 RepID=A0ABD1N862_9FABA